MASELYPFHPISFRLRSEIKLIQKMAKLDRMAGFIIPLLLSLGKLIKIGNNLISISGLYCRISHWRVYSIIS